MTIINKLNENKKRKLLFNIFCTHCIFPSLKKVDNTGRILFKKNTQITIKTSIIFIGKLYSAIEISAWFAVSKSDNNMISTLK